MRTTELSEEWRAPAEQEQRLGAEPSWRPPGLAGFGAGARNALTLVKGIDRAFDPLEGMHPVQTKHALEARRLAVGGAAIVGSDTTWAELTPRRVQYLVRALAGDSEQGRGARTAEYMCDML